MPSPFSFISVICFSRAKEAKKQKTKKNYYKIKKKNKQTITPDLRFSMKPVRDTNSEPGLPVVDLVLLTSLFWCKFCLKNMNNIIKQEGLYQGKVISSLAPPVTVKWAFELTSYFQSFNLVPIAFIQNGLLWFRKKKSEKNAVLFRRKLLYY